MLTDPQLREALRDCYDPDLPCNIVDLGLLLDTSITPDLDAPGTDIPGVPKKSRVTVTLILSNPSAEAEAHMKAQIANRLAGLETISHTSVTILPAPAWSPQRITPAGRRLLGLDGNPHLVQIR